MAEVITALEVLGYLVIVVVFLFVLSAIIAGTIDAIRNRKN